MTMLISKFHKLIQSKIIWGGFALLISVAFVIAYNPATRNAGFQQSKKTKDVVGKLYGEDVTRGELFTAYTHTRLEYIFSTGKFMPKNAVVEEMLNQVAWQRIAILKKAATLNLTVTPDQIRAQIKSSIVFKDRATGGFSKQAYNNVVKMLNNRFRMNEKQLDNFFREQVLIGKISSIISSGALATDEDIKKAFHLVSDQLTVEYVILPQDIAKTPKISDEQITTYFETYKEKFRIPEKRIANYIELPVSNFTNDVIITDATVTNEYTQNKRFSVKTPATNAPPNAAIEFKSLAEVKGEIVKTLTDQLARQKAINLADELVAELANETVKLETITKKMGLKIKTTPKTFTKNGLVDGIDPTARFAENAFRLTKDPSNYYSDVVPGKDSVYVIFFKQIIPSRLPTLAEAKELVLKDVKLVEKEKAYATKANDIHDQIKADLKKGISFADTIKKFRFELKTTKPFDVTTELEEPFANTLKSATVWFKQGTLTELLTTDKEFFVAYIAKKEIADETKKLPEMRESLAGGIVGQKMQRLTKAWRENILKEANFEDLSETKKKK